MVTDATDVLTEAQSTVDPFKLYSKGARGVSAFAMVPCIQ